jgi:hypothetical protein
MQRASAFAGLALFVVASAAPAATLTHAYEFTSGVTDTVGGVNGTLYNGASVSGGKLLLDGIDDFTELSGKIIPTDGSDYSLLVRYSTSGLSQNYYYEEIVSQGSSGGPGFYLGYVGGDVRLTDHFAGGTGNALSQNGGFHDLLVTSGAGGTRLFIDGVSVYTTATYLSVGTSGSNTRFGNQFCCYTENFKGSLDSVRVFSGLATYAEATSGLASLVPEPASWAMMIGGFGMIGAAMRRWRPKIRLV